MKASPRCWGFFGAIRQSDCRYKDTREKKAKVLSVLLMQFFQGSGTQLGEDNSASLTFWLINGRQPDLEVLPGSPDAWWTLRIGSFWGKRESGREPLLPAEWRGSACCGWCQGALLQGKVLSIYPKFSFLSAVLINLLQNKWHHFWLDIWPKLSRSRQAQLG